MGEIFSPAILTPRMGITPEAINILNPIITRVEQFDPRSFPATETGTTDTLGMADISATKVYSSASAVTVTIPANSDVAFPIGTTIKAVRTGAGLVTFSPAGGVTLRKPTGIKPNRSMRAMVKKSADQTNADYTTIAAITFDSETEDTDAFHDTSSNTSRFTIPSGLGIKKVRLSAHVRITNYTANSYIALFTGKNGNLDFDGMQGRIVQSALTVGEIGLTTAPVTCTDADFFQLSLEVTGDTTISVIAARTTWAIEVVEIDAQGTIAHQYGEVTLLKIGADEWVISGPGLG